VWPGPRGGPYGDRSLIQLAAEHPRLREAGTVDTPVGWLDRISRISGVLGLIVTTRRSRAARAIDEASVAIG
ncbi:MAG: hypothetical protein ACRD15_19555, partial [Vicinamibacterales bacterium]